MAWLFCAKATADGSMRRRLERWLRCAADAEPYLQVVMPWLLAELRAQFRRAMLHVFT
jgi:hypothetical protein